jgi:hypothetical protein
LLTKKDLTKRMAPFKIRIARYYHMEGFLAGKRNFMLYGKMKERVEASERTYCMNRTLYEKSLTTSVVLYTI